MNMKKNSAAELVKTETETTEPNKTAKIVKTDNSQNGHLTARRAERAAAKKGAN